ncbi:hypothetical protein QTP86_001074 [Hemibagrus guttatus]|nr:hypothetical protein QTP86_001074 [Hemibagrus guttatus]
MFMKEKNLSARVPVGSGPLWSRPHGFGGLASIFHYDVPDYRSGGAVRHLAENCQRTIKNPISRAVTSHDTRLCFIFITPRVPIDGVRQYGSVSILADECFLSPHVTFTVGLQAASFNPGHAFGPARLRSRPTPDVCRAPALLSFVSCKDRECAPDTVCEDAEDGRLTRRRCSPGEGDEGEEEDEEHSCRSCHQVFDSASDLSQHKINQCQLTDLFISILCYP